MALAVELIVRRVETSGHGQFRASQAEVDVEAVFDGVVHLVDHRAEHFDERSVAVGGAGFDSPGGDIFDRKCRMVGQGSFKERLLAGQLAFA